jgi:hypothetical protein
VCAHVLRGTSLQVAARAEVRGKDHELALEHGVVIHAPRPV